MSGPSAPGAWMSSHTHMALVFISIFCSDASAFPFRAYMYFNFFFASYPEILWFVRVLWDSWNSKRGRVVSAGSLKRFSGQDRLRLLN